MKKKNFKLSVLLGTMLLLLVTGISVTMIRSNVAQAKTDKVFTASTGVAQKNNQSIPSNLIGNDNRKGVLLTAQESGAAIAFADIFSGKFEMDFQIFTQRVLTEADVASGAFAMEPDLNSLTLKITDADNPENTFAVQIDGTGSEIAGVPQARVIYGGKEAGIYYNAKFYWNGYKQTEDRFYKYNYDHYYRAHMGTKLANSNGLYSYLVGTSFDNAYWFEDTYCKDANSMILGFDAQSMEVYAYSQDKRIVIWDLDQRVNSGKDGGFVLSGFEKYKVSLEFTSIAKGKTARMMVYEVCGQSLTGTDDGAPTLRSNLPDTAVMGDRITIEKPIIYDVVDKSINVGQVAVSVTDPNGSEVSVEKLGSNGTWQNGTHFMVEKKGIYTVKFELADGSGNVGTVSHEITVSDGTTSSRFVFLNEPKDIVIGKGMSLNFEKPYAVNADGEKLTVKSEILLDGVIKHTESGQGTLSYTFAEAGKYTVRYTIKETWKTSQFTITVSDELPVLEGLDVLDIIYMLNEEIILPEVQLSQDGKNLNSQVIIEFPDGTRYKNTQFTPEVPGLYKMIVTCDEIDYIYEAAFYVSNNSDTLFSVLASATVTGDSVDPTRDDMEGVLITTNGAGQVAYNKHIDFSGKEEKYTFLKIKATPEAWNTQEMGELIIKLTDVKDENNYITIKMLADGDMESMSDIQASAFGYPTKGLRGNSIKENRWGTMVAHSFKKPADYIYLAFDPKTQCIYANDSLVVDLDNTTYFTKAFTGFSEGKCSMTIETSDLKKPTASFMVLEVDGMDFSGNAIVDREKPMINVAYNGYLESTIPNALVGINYKLFEASAFDKIDGDMEVQTSVYFFKNNVRYLVDSSSKGFTPRKAGQYVIVYSATDSSGNLAEYEISVKAVTKKVDIIVDGGASKVKVKAGNTYTLPGVSASGGFGNLDVTVKVSSPNNQKVKVKNNKITLTEIGNYQVVYSVEDYIGQKKNFTITLTSEKNPNPIVNLLGEVPEFIFAGEEYIFCDFSALDYSGNKVQDAKKRIEVVFNGKTQTLEGNTFTPEIPSGNTGKLKVNFKGIGAQGEAVVSKEVTVIKLKNPQNQNFSILKNYFYGAEYTVEAGESLVYGTNTSKAGLKFVRPIVASDIDIGFTLLSASVTDSIKVTMRDSENSSEYFQIVFEKAEDKITARIVGDSKETIHEVGGSFDGKGKAFKVYYNEKTGMLSASDAKNGAKKDLAIVTNKPDGSAFTGFSSHKAYVEIQVGDLSGRALVRIDNVCNQVFSNAEVEDLTRPLIYVLGDYNIVNHKGDKVVMYEAVVSDVLSATNLSYSLSAPNKLIFSEKTDKAGYSFKIDQYGYYNIVYNVKDDAGMKGDLNIPIYSAFVGKIKLKCPDVASKVKVGTKISFKGFKATSEAMEICSIHTCVIIIDSEGVFRSVSNETMSYTFEKPGKYTVRFYAVDDDANTVWKDFSVTVK